jgi:rRNA processing protein Gar1
LKVLGNICGTTHSGELLVKLENLPRIHQKIHDNRKKEIGRVVYVFGNVKTPYAVVRAFQKKNLLQMMGRIVYTR